MLRRTLRSFAVVAGFCTASGAFASVPENSTAPITDTMKEMTALFPPIQPSLPAPTNSYCSASYTIPQNVSLENVNRLLGNFHAWLEVTNRLNENFSDEFFMKRNEAVAEEERFAVTNAYEFMFEYSGVYQPGTEEGLYLLQQNPDLAVRIIAAYAEHAAAQRYMLESDVQPENMAKYENIDDKKRAAILFADFSSRFDEQILGYYTAIETANLDVEALECQAAPATMEVSPAP